jgi:uncharacterized protein
MSAVFADTHYFAAQFNPKDQHHAKAVAFTNGYTGDMVTTDWVLVEIADAFAQQPNRARFVALYESLQASSQLHIVPADRATLQTGVSLYSQRLDKAWSLTDCISFVVMQREGLTDALTGDRHFEQAGFTILLK